jgi:hypothetical protein
MMECVRMLQAWRKLIPSTAAKPFRGRTRQRQWEQLSRGIYVPRARPSRELLHG